MVDVVVELKGNGLIPPNVSTASNPDDWDNCLRNGSALLDCSVAVDWPGLTSG